MNNYSEKYYARLAFVIIPLLKEIVKILNDKEFSAKTRILMIKLAIDNSESECQTSMHEIIAELFTECNEFEKDGISLVNIYYPLKFNFKVSCHQN
jgi:uncharacterized protein Yka (UPF0111/DUF47 family)